jgi:hypothetical protein
MLWLWNREALGKKSRKNQKRKLTTISRWRTNESRPSYLTLFAIAKVLTMDVKESFVDMKNMDYVIYKDKPNNHLNIYLKSI